MIVAEIKGNLLDTNISHIAHGVNCRNTMGSGVAKALYEKYPEVKKQYHVFYEENINWMINGSEDFLGKINCVEVDTGKFVFNMFTQLDYGVDGKLYVNYDAIRTCFSTLAENGLLKSIAIPKIGCGLAGGDWEKVKSIINEATRNLLDVYVYYLE